MEELYKNIIALVVGFSGGILFDPIKAKVNRYFNRPKIEIEIHFWNLNTNSMPPSYTLDCMMSNEGETTDHLREIKLIVNPNRMETKYYGLNRYICGQDIQRLEINPHESRNYTTDHLWASLPHELLRNTIDNDLSNYREVQLVFKFSIHTDIKVILKEDIKQGYSRLI